MDGTSDPRSRRHLDRPARSVHPPPGHRSPTADAAADLPRPRALLAANAIQMLSVAGMFAMFFLGALYLQLRTRL